MRRVLFFAGMAGLAITVSSRPAGSQEAELSSGMCVRPIEEVRIGALGSDANELFGQVQSVTAGDDGSIFVADLHPQSVRQFDESGDFIRSIGREGQGPGEYRSLLGVEALEGGEVAIWDYWNRRISIFDSAAQLQQEIHLPGGVYSDDPFLAGTADVFFVKIRGGGPSVSRNGRLRFTSYAYLVVGRDGSIRDTLTLPPEGIAGSFVTRTPAGSRRSFPTRTLAAVTPSGDLVVGSNARYAFGMITDTGSIEVVRDDWDPVPLTPEERAEWEGLRRHLQTVGGRALDPIPDRKPAYRRLWVDDEGRVWVQRHVAAEKRDAPTETVTRSGRSRPAITWLEPAVYDLYGREGGFLRCLELPWNSRVLESRGRYLWGVLKGEFDEEMVVRWSVPGG